MKLSLGRNLDPSNLAEGNDVYLECEIRAHPKAYKVVWMHNVSKSSACRRSILRPPRPVLCPIEKAVEKGRVKSLKASRVFVKRLRKLRKGKQAKSFSLPLATL